MTDKKQVVFTVFVENVSGGKIETYSSAYFDLMLSHALCENIETKWYRRCNYKENEFDFSVTEYLSRTSCFEHTATIKRETSGYKSFNTTSRAQYRGGENEQITVSSALINGKFDGGDKTHTEFTDTAIAGDIIPLTLEKSKATGKKFPRKRSNISLKTYTVRTNSAPARRITRDLISVSETFFSSSNPRFYGFPITVEEKSSRL